jgi:hypothetical protein
MSLDKYRVTGPMIDPNTGRKRLPGETVRMTGRQADKFYYSGRIDNSNKVTRRGRVKHELDKRRI